MVEYMFDWTMRSVDAPEGRGRRGVGVGRGDIGSTAFPAAEPTTAVPVPEPVPGPPPDQVPELMAAARAGGPAEFVALARFAERQVARYDAIQLRALGMIARARPPEPGELSGLPFARSAAADLAARLDITVTEAIARLQLAWTLTGRLSSVLEALEAGQINLDQAKAVARWSPPKARTAPATLTGGSLRRVP